ncbi:hypothetical protein LJB86_04530 [Deltaproteobacteria bacterium OttesenSCG-928-M10]|nr:hypothetical protein [Deltaproteobacteria bacterium OttesenSCG-928-M10]
MKNQNNEIMKSLPEFVDYLLSQAQYELSGRAAVDLIIHYELSGRDDSLYYAERPEEIVDLFCHRLLISPAPLARPLVLTVYYSQSQVLKFDRPRFVVDKNVITEKMGANCAFISVVASDEEEAGLIVETFLDALGVSKRLKTGPPAKPEVIPAPRYH